MYFYYVFSLLGLDNNYNNNNNNNNNNSSNNNNNNNNNNNDNNNNKMAAGTCCGCNGIHAKCVKCSCVKKKQTCLNCLPLRNNRCHNTIESRQAVVCQDTCPTISSTSTSHAASQPGLRPTTQSLNSVPEVPGAPAASSICVEPCVLDAVGGGANGSMDVELTDNSVSVEDSDYLMRRAYGESIVRAKELDSIDNAWYERWLSIVRLSGRLYSLPGGAVGRRYVDQLSKEVSHVSIGNYSSERVIVFSSVILQRDRSVRKGPDVRRVIGRRLDMWQDDKFDLLIQEAVRCDKSLVSKRRITESHMSSVFTRLMLQGKVKSAVRWLSDYARGSVLSPMDCVPCSTSGGQVQNEKVIDILSKKHPNSVMPPKSSLMDCTALSDFETVEITGNIIQRVACMMQGSAGPGGCDATHWQDSLLRYGAHSASLRESVASLARTLANMVVSWSDIRALMACRLVALDKCPGVRPIGIGETLRRILGKAVALVTRYDIEDVCGISQLCVGVQSGLEGAVHAVNDLFNEHNEDGWGVLMVDASNAFNSINRLAILWNARVPWPQCSRFLFNTYRGWAPLFMKGTSTILYSQEGVTQGDPLSMLVYAIGTLPLIRTLKNPRDGIQIWYADDASACAALIALKDWFGKLIKEGPSYGYFPEPKKSFIVVSDPYLCEAHEVFESKLLPVIDCWVVLLEQRRGGSIM